MSEAASTRIDWAALWRSGDLGRFCFISLGILLHAGAETMLGTIMPALVRDIGGVQMVGWSFAIYEVGSIMAGAAAGRLSLRLSIRATMATAALLYALGCAVAALAPTMPWLLFGRLLEGFGGGALVALAFISVERLFPRHIWPQLFAIMSAIWGVAAFGGPLLGAMIEAASSWRWAFAAFGLGGIAMAAASLVVLREAPKADTPSVGAFPAMALLCLAGAVMLISAAGIEIELGRSTLLFALGFAGLVLFFVLDARNLASRLFPSRPFMASERLGAGLTMVATLSIATVSFGIYGPLLLSSLHGLSPLATGYIIASESLSWSLLSILVAGAPPRMERAIIFGGALMIAAGIAGFAYAVPAGSVPLILACALLQGGGFGIAWPFATRLIVEAAPPSERTIAAAAVPTMQRLGYAVGAAIAGMLANASGFSGGFTREAAADAAPVLFAAFVPLALVGCIAAWRLAGKHG